VRVLGIDEAGRGCVFGSLFIGGFLTEADDVALLAAGATDSKKLSVKKRLAARQALLALGSADIRAVTPAEIDVGNLNRLEEDVIVDLIKTHAPDRVLIDALGPPSTLPKLCARISKATGVADIQMRPKADLHWPPVGAASIYAKTERDDKLEEWAETFGLLGSGYPSDPKTRSWILEWARQGKPWPAFVRTKWSTVQDLAQQALL
jgi:ribonuclease HII